MGSMHGGKVAVVKSGRGLEVTSYTSELEAVKGMISNGTLGPGSSYFGSEAHVEALSEVERHIAEVREQIL